MSTKELVDIQLFSDQKGLSSLVDQEINVGVELNPHRSLKAVARERSAAPVITIILDCSGSMHALNNKGERFLDQMIRCASSVADLTSDHDEIRVIFFSTEVSEVHRVKGSKRDRLRSVIAEAKNHPYGNTNMKGALDRGIEDLQSVQDKSRHILLFTDGGPTGSKRAVVQSASRAAELGISVSVCGFNDQLRLPYLAEIATAGNGDTLRSTNEGQLQRHFQQFTRNAQQTGVTDLKLELTLHPALIGQHLLRGKPQNQYLREVKANERQVNISIGALNAGSWQMLVLNGRIFRELIQSHVPLLSACVSYVVPSVGPQRHRSPIMELNLPIESAQPRIDRALHNALIPTLIMIKVRRFEKLDHKKYPREAEMLMRSIIQEYRSLETPMGNAAAEAFIQKLNAFTGGQGPSNRDVNELSEATSTAITGVRLSDVFNTNSATRGGSHSITNAGSITQRGTTNKPRRREVMEFDI